MKLSRAGPHVPNVTGMMNGYANYQTMRGFSPATIKRRAVTLRRWTAYLVPGDFAAATPQDVEDFLRPIVARRTRHAYRSDLNSFYVWAVRRSLLPTNPVAFTDPIKVPRSLPRPLSVDDVLLVVGTAPTGRLQRACALAAYAGLRRSEIANLDATDLGWEPPLIVVRDGKGGKDRVVPMAPALRVLLLAGMSGPIVGGSPDSVGYQMTTHMRRVLGREVTPHQLRHSFATEVARLGVDLRVLASWMGHESVQTTEGYARLTLALDGGVLGDLYEPRSLAATMKGDAA